MRAVRIHAKGDVRVSDVESPVIAPGKVLLSGGYTGICGSDLHMYFAPETFHWDFSSPAPLTGASWPQILGHEFSGEVVGVGAGVENLSVGDHVAVFPYHFCGKCAACLAGSESLCELIEFEGIQGRSGGMAQVKIVDAQSCFVLGDGADLRLGALVEPMAVAWRGVALADPDPAGGAIVVGGGPIGIGAFFALQARGVETIIVSEPSAERRAVLARLGVEHIVDPMSQSLVERTMELTGEVGAGVAIDCAGAPAAFPEAMMALTFNGRMVIVAVYEQPLVIGPLLMQRQKSIRTSSVYTREDFAAVIDAMGRGVYRTDGGWIETITFDEVEAAIHDLRQGKRMKVLVETPT